MTVYVRFSSGGSAYAIPVERARGVQRAEGVSPLPSPVPDVVGIATTDGAPLTVVAPFGNTGRYVVVVDTGELPVAIVVDEVNGVIAVDDADIGAAPAGQRDAVITGVATIEGVSGVTLIVDPCELASSLGVAS